MWAELFQPNGNKSRCCRIFTTILSLIKDTLNIANTFFQVELLRNVIECLNEIVNLTRDAENFNDI